MDTFLSTSPAWMAQTTLDLLIPLQIPGCPSQRLLPPSSRRDLTPAFFSDSSALIREAKRGLDAPKDRCPTVSLLEPALSHQKTGQARQNNKPNRKCVRLAQVSSCCLRARGTTLYIAAQGTQLASEARATFRVVDAATAHFSTCYPYEGPKGDYSNGPATRG